MHPTMTILPIESKQTDIPQSNSCRRCGGILVHEQCIDLAGSEGGYRFWASRCIQCGDLVDPVILRNRLNPPHAEESIEQIENTIEHAA